MKKSNLLTASFVVAFLTLGVSATYAGYTSSGSSNITGTAGRFASSVEGILTIPIESNDSNMFNYLTAIPYGPNSETDLEPGMAPAEVSFIVKNSGNVPTKLRFYDSRRNDFVNVDNNASEVVHIQIFVNNTSVYKGPMKDFQSNPVSLGSNTTNNVKFIWTWPITGKTAQDMLPYLKQAAGTELIIETST